MSEAAFGSFVAQIPPPLGIDTITLDDGNLTKGFIFEHYAVTDARTITEYGGWRKLLASRS